MDVTLTENNSQKIIRHLQSHLIPQNVQFITQMPEVALFQDQRGNSWTSVGHKTRVLCSMLFTVPTTGGFRRKPDSAQRVHAQTIYYQENLAGFLLSALHSRAFHWLSAAPLVFLFLGFLP
jgi:hypothetical protein